VYHSRAVQSKVEIVTEYVGLDQSDVFPIRNITKETTMSRTLHEQILALMAFKGIIESCETRILRLMAGKNTNTYLK